MARACRACGRAGRAACRARASRSTSGGQGRSARCPARQSRTKRPPCALGEPRGVHAGSRRGRSSCRPPAQGAVGRVPCHPVAQTPAPRPPARCGGGRWRDPPRNPSASRGRWWRSAGWETRTVGRAGRGCRRSARRTAFRSAGARRRPERRRDRARAGRGPPTSDTFVPRRSRCSGEPLHPRAHGGDHPGRRGVQAQLCVLREALHHHHPHTSATGGEEAQRALQRPGAGGVHHEPGVAEKRGGHRAHRAREVGGGHAALVANRVDDHRAG